MNSQVNMSERRNPVHEFRKLEQAQASLILNTNLFLKKQVEEYLNKQENILDENGEIREELVNDIVDVFLKFTENIILHQERVRKLKNREKISAKDVDDQLFQFNLYNWWATRQMDLYYKLKSRYHLQKSKEYEG